MYRVDLAGAADQTLTAMPDDMHEEALALIDDAVASVQTGSGARMVVDAVLRGRCWIVYAALGGLFVVLDVGRAG